MSQGKNTDRQQQRNELDARRSKLIRDKGENKSRRKESTSCLNSTFHFQNAF